ncbi:MAG TPA: CarD family transcriptional regulator, partial [Dehalococcoidia bacterium]|nr:CarD family transcriptional regulator [Dehalococcoidia bacterium]
MNLSSLLKPVSESLAQAAGRRSRQPRHTLIGAGDNAKPAVIAALARDAEGPVLIVVPKSARMQDLYEELGTWLGPEDGRRLRFYPERDMLPYERATEDPWDVRTRLETLAALHGDGDAGRPIVIATAEGIAQRTLSPEAMRDAVSRIDTSTRMEPEALLRRLQQAGYEIVSLVEAPGQAARRGGIVDVFPPQADSPARIEFFGPEVESVRLFDVATQRSRERVGSIDLGAASEFSPDAAMARELLHSLDFGAAGEETEESIREELNAIAHGESVAGPSFLPGLLSPYTLIDHLPDNATVVLDDPNDLSRALDEYVAETATMRIEREARGQLPIGLPAAQANWSELQPRLLALKVVELSRFSTEEGGAIRPPFSPAPGFGGRVRILARDLAEMTRKGDAVVIVSQQASRLQSLLADEGLPVRTIDDAPDGFEAGVIQLLKGSLPHGWSFHSEQIRGLKPPASMMLVLTDAEIFGFVKQRRALRQSGADRSGLIADLTPGDYVVHLEHGIGRFAGMVVRDVEGIQKEFLELTYAQGDRLFVPVDQSDRVARYVGPGDHRPDLTRLGSGEWTRTRERVRRAVADVARDLLDL